MPTAAARIWNPVADSISYDNIRYAKRACKLSLKYVFYFVFNRYLTNAKEPCLRSSSLFLHS